MGTRGVGNHYAVGFSANVMGRESNVMGQGPMCSASVLRSHPTRARLEGLAQESVRTLRRLDDKLGVVERADKLYR